VKITSPTYIPWKGEYWLGKMMTCQQLKKLRKDAIVDKTEN
jgi:hypothetical protein